MSLFKKLKDIIFDEEEVEVTKEVKKEEPLTKPIREEKKEVSEIKVETPEPIRHENPISEREIFKNENTFPFPEFDEDEFDNNLGQAYRRENPTPKPKPAPAPRPNVMEYERVKKVEKRTEYNSGREKIESYDVKEKRKFKPSPIISPVYGVLNEDYKPEDIKNRTTSDRVSNDTSSIDVDAVRKKAFGELENLEKTFEKPASVFYEEIESVTTSYPDFNKTEKVKTIDELLEDTSDIKVDIKDEFDITEEVTVPIREEKVETKRTVKKQIIDEFEEDDSLEDDFLNLFESMYENKEEE